jgi:hypothetical protein
MSNCAGMIGTKGSSTGVEGNHEMLINIKGTITRQQPTIGEKCSVQVVVHEAGKMPRRPKEYDHPLAPCNLAF